MWASSIHIFRPCHRLALSARINLGTIDNCFSLCTLNADYNVGGICGQNFGKVNNCFSAGKLLIENYSSNYGGICCNFYTARCAIY